MGALAKLTQLTALDIGGATLTDSGLDRANRTAVERTEMPQIRELGALVRLRKLDLSGLSVSNRDLRFLEELSELRELNLGRAENIDDGIAGTLSALPKLEVLHLTGAAVGDATLEALATAPSLKRLSVGGTAVSEEAVERFRQRRADCVLTWFPKREEPDGPEDTVGK